MKNKGQITAFIIIGVILLVSMLIFMYFRTATLVEPEVIPPEFEPVKDYVSACLKIASRAAIEQLGQKSGYVYVPPEWQRQQDSYIAIGNHGLLKIPYWYYLGESRIPSIGFMESQISAYIEDNIGLCLQDFSMFENRYEIRPRGNIIVSTTIAENDVLVEAEYPLRVKSVADGRVIALTSYTASSDVRLKKIYDTATAFMEFENRNMVIENATLDIMAMHPDIPQSGLTFDCSPQRWYVEDIKEELSGVMRYHLSRVRIKDTDYLAFESAPEEYQYFAGFDGEDIFNGRLPNRAPPSDAYDYFHYYYDINIPRNNLRVALEYDPSWGMDITARPSSGGVLRSDINRGMQRYLSYMCINFHHFTYDVEYPVSMVLADNEAFNGDGYIFRFAFPVLIKSNEGNRVDLGSNVYDTTTQYLDYCGFRSGPLYDIRAVGMDEDGYSDMEITGAEITYDCLSYRCELGSTSSVLGGYGIRTQLPEFCGGGFIHAEKEGYLRGTMQVTDSERLRVEMQKLKSFNVSIHMHNYHSMPPARVEAGTIPLENDMSVLITIQPHSRPDYYQFISYPFEADAPLNLKELSLLDKTETYSLDIMLTNDRFGLLGGYRGNWTVTASEMSGMDHIDFHIIRYLPIPVAATEQYSMIMMLEQDESYRSTLAPQFRQTG